MKKLTILAPVYQNAENLPITLPKLLDIEIALRELSVQTEILLVDDGSRDSSLEIARNFQSQYPEIFSLIKLTRNFGQIAALQAGVLKSQGDAIIMISADLQDPPELILSMISKWLEGYKFVIAERSGRQDKGFNSFVSTLFWKLFAKYALPGYPQGGFDFCLIDRSIAELLNSFNERNTHIFPLIYYMGYKPYVFRYERATRTAGKSQWTFSKKIKLFLDTFIGFSYLPIRLISSIGIGISALSLLFGAYAIVSYFIVGNQFTGWTSLATMTSAIGGMILLGLGIIAEYLWRILDQVRTRPRFIIEDYRKTSSPADARDS
jgi:dolichol-phosphate mannosyltransferase